MEENIREQYKPFIEWSFKIKVYVLLVGWKKNSKEESFKIGYEWVNWSYY